MMKASDYMGEKPRGGAGFSKNMAYEISTLEHLK